MKRSVTIVLIIVILINTIFPNFIYASDYGSYEEAQEHQQEGGTINNKLWEEGTANVISDKSSRTEDITESNTVSNLVADVLGGIIAILPKAVNTVLTVVVYSTQEDGFSGPFGAAYAVINKEFTIEDLIFGKYTLFDINYFDYGEASGEKNVNTTIKENIASWYFVLRNIAMIISVLVLIYVGIRMAISTVASEQAKYKKMLISWVTSFILLFVMQYIFIFLLGLQESLLEIVATWANGKGFEEQIVESILATILSASGFNIVAAAIEYCMLVYYQVKFFLLYFKRFLEVGFLLVISPLVTITYPIDKIGDGKAQAYSAWFTRIVYNMFLQLIHATVYIIFIYSAGEIAKKAPILGILFLTTLSRIEKIIRATFGLRGQGLSDEKLLDKIKRG